MKETKCGNSCEVHIRRGRKVIAYTNCFYANGDIHIKSLFVRRAFRGKGLSEVLLARIMDYAAEKNASRIISFCGAEPFCEDGQIPMDQEVSWYENHGFTHDHDVLGVTPCMIRELNYA